MPVLLVVGSINMDVVAVVDRPPLPGETITAVDARLVNGGKGANAAVAAARLGGTVRFRGAVGDDAFGPALRAGLEANGIDCAGLATLPGSSGIAQITVDRASGQNAIVFAPGANFAFRLPPEGDDTFLDGVDTLLLQLETPPALTLEAARRAHRRGVRVVLDPAPARNDLPDALFAHCDVVSPNESELAILVGRAPEDGQTATPLEDIEAEARRLLARGAGAVAVKLGARGGLWVTATESIHAAAPPITPVDTTAAGDSFTGALALGLAEGRPLRDVMAEAVAAGSLACLTAGAQPSLPTRAAVAEFMAASAARENRG